MIRSRCRRRRSILVSFYSLDRRSGVVSGVVSVVVAMSGVWPVPGLFFLRRFVSYGILCVVLCFDVLSVFCVLATHLSNREIPECPNSARAPPEHNSQIT